MEISITSFPFLLALLIFVLALFRTVASKSRNPALNLPPGPPKLPLLGNIPQLLGQSPHRSLRFLARKYGPLIHLRLGEIPTVVVSSPEVAAEVLRVQELRFADRPGLAAAQVFFYGCTDIVFSPFGDYWRKLRKISQTHLLSVKSVESFRSVREEEVAGFVGMISDAAEARSSFNLSKHLYLLNYGITARVAFGGKKKDQEAFLSAVIESFRYMTGFNVVDMYPSLKFLGHISGRKAKMNNLHRVLDGVLENIVEEHKQKKTTRAGDGAGEDIVDVILRVREEEGMEISDDNIKGVILDIFAAGSDTVSAAVEWAMSEIVKTPGVMRRAQEEVRRVFHGKGNVDDETRLCELKYLKSVMKETLRLHPPVPLISRECRESCRIHGYDVPSKTMVLVNTWAIGRYPEQWVDAERFQPERFLDNPVEYRGSNFEFIPFGAGRRICPGVVFATASMEVLLAQLLFHFNWELPEGMKAEELGMAEEFGLTLNRKEDLNLIPLRHQFVEN